MVLVLSLSFSWSSPHCASRLTTRPAPPVRPITNSFRFVLMFSFEKSIAVFVQSHPRLSTFTNNYNSSPFCASSLNPSPCNTPTAHNASLVKVALHSFTFPLPLPHQVTTFAFSSVSFFAIRFLSLFSSCGFHFFLVLPSSSPLSNTTLHFSQPLRRAKDFLQTSRRRKLNIFHLTFTPSRLRSSPCQTSCDSTSSAPHSPTPSPSPPPRLSFSPTLRSPPHP